MRIGVDIDGVLADQVAAVLAEIEKDYGRRYSKSDIDRAHWSFDGIEIWTEISRHLSDPEYVLRVPTIEGARAAVKRLLGHELLVVTARRPNTEEATRMWLSVHFPCLTRYHHARTGTKQSIPCDLLIDDLDLNIVEFVRSDPLRRGILFQHPWSLNETDIGDYDDQVFYCPRWSDVLNAVDEIDRDFAVDGSGEREGERNGNIERTGNIKRNGDGKDDDRALERGDGASGGGL